MDVHSHTRDRWTIGMAVSLGAVVVITLTPRGSGWAWGSPLDEARWYLTGLNSTSTMLQLAGNLLLLVVPFGLAAIRWPALGRLRLLAALSLAAGATIELLQWALPLGRVVSPLDAVLNATGALPRLSSSPTGGPCVPATGYSRSSTPRACQGTTPSTLVRPTLDP